MHESGTWRARPGQVLSFGRSAGRTIRLPAGDRGVSRSAGRLVFEGGAWWLHNDSSSSVLYVAGDRGFRVDLPPGMGAPVQQCMPRSGCRACWAATRCGCACPISTMYRSRGRGRAGGGVLAGPTGEHLLTTTRRRPPLNDADRLILAARFEDYLNWRHTGAAAPRSAKQAADRIGWQAHTVAKRCENIRDRYARLGVPGLRGPRALEELAMLLISTGELTAVDLRRLPRQSHELHSGGRHALSAASVASAGNPRAR